ncbi:unnamed protein product [Calicophoron daubneyi]|uniref:Uncharacterized protein n=1 Tax=Calicophoron daubneyi TaxID=300641 RepID=A0AAV2U2M2_CALDB
MYYRLHSIVLFEILCLTRASPVDKNDARKYSVIIDAGSSGSRSFVYTWLSTQGQENTLPVIDLLMDNSGSPVVTKVNPGLSTFSKSLGEIPDYLASLLKKAAESIPSTYHTQTSIAIYATAGMRLLPEGEQSAIWEAVRNAIKSGYRFWFVDSMAATITGEQEALFGWVTVNYLLGRFRTENGKPDPNPVGMVEMGGASMQIAFPLGPAQHALDNLVTRFAVPSPTAKQNHRVYIVSHLQFGSNSARGRYEQALLYAYEQQNGSLPGELQIADPCLMHGQNITKNISARAPDDLDFSKPQGKQVKVTLNGAGNYMKCHENVKLLLPKTADCKPVPCALEEVVQPAINYSVLDFYGLSEYVYSLSDVFNPKTDKYAYSVVLNKIKALCSKDWEQYKIEYRASLQEMSDAEFEELLQYKVNICFKAVYVFATLYDVYGMPEDYTRFYPTLEIENKELTWSLGAAVYMIATTEFDNKKSNSQQLEAQRQTVISLAVAVGVLGLGFLGLMTAFLWKMKQYKKAHTEQDVEVERRENNDGGNDADETDFCDGHCIVDVTNFSQSSREKQAASEPNRDSQTKILVHTYSLPRH